MAFFGLFDFHIISLFHIHVGLSETSPPRYSTVDIENQETNSFVLKFFSVQKIDQRMKKIVIF